MRSLLLVLALLFLPGCPAESVGIVGTAAPLPIGLSFPPSSSLETSPKAVVSTSGAVDFDASLIHEGAERLFHVHLPPAMRAVPSVASFPVIYVFHGFSKESRPGLAQAEVSRIHAVADHEGFIVVHPEGLLNPGTLWHSWDAGECCAYGDTGRDDVGFVSVLSDYITTHFRADPDRTFAAGFSNGGYFAYRLASDLPGTFRAIGCVSALMDPAFRFGSDPVPVIAFHGTADPALSYRDAADVVAYWIARNRGAYAGTVYSQGDASAARWEGRAPVEFFTIQGGNHTWPGGTPGQSGGEPSYDVSATEELFRFFKAAI